MADAETQIVVGSADDGEPPSFFLCADFPRIMRFFGLDLAPWSAGFATQAAVFDWVRSSRLFHPACMRESARREHRRRDRAMFHAFLQYVRDLDEAGAYSGTAPLAAAEVVAQAKREFGKEDEYNALVRANRRRVHLKAVFNGHLVMAWTGLQGLPVRGVMDAVRALVTDDDMFEMSVEDVEALVRRVHAERTATTNLLSAT